MIKVGIIGGSGFDDPQMLEEQQEVFVENKYGKLDAPLLLGKIHNVEVVILSRHGVGHSVTPTNVNYRANILALKEQGVTHIIATTAVGSLREEIGRGDIVIVDQFIDFTKHRDNTYFEDFANGVVHTQMSEPFDKQLREVLIKTSNDLGYKTHPTGTVVTIEGPRFSTKAESKMFRLWGADIINMSIAIEAILANEIHIPYATIAMSTDYDCWKEDEEPVTFDEILKVFTENVSTVKKILINSLPLIK